MGGEEKRVNGLRRETYLGTPEIGKPLALQRVVAGGRGKKGERIFGLPKAPNPLQQLHRGGEGKKRWYL